MKIIFVNRYFYPDESATSMVLTDLAFHLAGNDYVHEGSEQMLRPLDIEVHVITSRQLYDNAAVKLPATEEVNRVRVHRVWTTRFGRHNLAGRLLDYLTFYFCAVMRLALLASRNDVVVIKTDPPLLSIPAWPVTAGRGARQLNWLHDLFPEVAINYGVRGLKGIFGNILINFRNFSLRLSHMNIVIGERMRQKLMQEEVPSEKVRVIHNWSEGLPAEPVPRTDNPLIRKWELEDKFIVAYSGNLGRGHEFRTIIDAARELRGYRDIIFLFIGGGAHFAQLMREQQELELPNLMFKPYQPRDMLKYSLVLPHVHLVTLSPGMGGLMVPSKIYGIAAAGRPMLYIGDEDSEVPGIIAAADCGVSLRAGAVADLVRAIVEMQAHPGRLEEMGRKGREFFKERYSSGRAYKQWEELIADVVRNI